MPEWLQDVSANGGPLSVAELAGRLLTAFALGCSVAGIYWLTQRKQRSDLTLVTTLVLLAVLIAMVTLVIGNSVARAFSLVGALAIVRFRTVVEDTRDTAFVIFAVVVGMAAGAGYLLVPLLGIPVVAAAAVLFNRRAGGKVAASEGTLTVRVGLGRDPGELLGQTFAKHLERWRLTTTVTARQGAALDLTYEVRLRHEGALVPLAAELNQLEGVQGVELRLS